MAKAAKKETSKKSTKDTAKKAKAAKAEPKKAVKKEAPAKVKAPKAVKKQAEVPVIEAEVAAPEQEEVVEVVKEGKAAKAKRVAREKASSESNQKWSELKEKHAGEKAAPYSMSSVYEPNRPLQHKVLGWGWILNVQNDRLEVLFEDGTKMLISNYKPR